MEKIATLTLRHAYLGAKPVQVEFAPLDAVAFQQQGLRMVNQDGALSIFQPVGAKRPSTVSVVVTLPEPEIRGVTTIDGDLLGTDRFCVVARPERQTPTIRRIEEAKAKALGLPRHATGLVELGVPSSGAIETSYTFDVAHTHWVYVLLNAPADTLVTQPDGPHVFAKSVDTLPDGLLAPAFRSELPIPLSPSNDHGFFATGTFDDGTVRTIRLPMAGARIAGPDLIAPDRLMSEIFLRL